MHGFRFLNLLKMAEVVHSWMKTQVPFLQWFFAQCNVPFTGLSLVLAAKKTHMQETQLLKLHLCNKVSAETATLIKNSFLKEVEASVYI